MYSTLRAKWVSMSTLGPKVGNNSTYWLICSSSRPPQNVSYQRQDIAPAETDIIFDCLPCQRRIGQVLDDVTRLFGSMRGSAHIVLYMRLKRCVYADDRA